MEDQTAVAAETSTAIEPDFSAYMSTANAKDIAAARGETPAKPKTEDSAPSDPPKVETSDAGQPAQAEAVNDSASAPEPETGKPQGQPEKRGKLSAAERLVQVLAEQRELKAEIERLKRVEPVKAETKPEPATGKVQEVGPQLADTKPDGSPKYESYEDWVDARAEWKAEQKFASIKTAEAEAKVKEAKATEEKERADNWHKRIAEATTRHADFKDVALNPDLPVPEGSVIDGFILDSPHGAEILYQFGSNPDELQRISALSPYDQAREFVKMEMYLSGSITPAAKKVTGAPKPPINLGAKGSAPADEIAAASKNEDFESYKRLRDREVIAAAQGR